ncbi:hypothetical protein N9L68_09005 [bacterium]|nr:hypothetical protein [bacterium]
MFLCWGWPFPTGTPTERQHVDAGSRLYDDTLQNIPVLHPKDHAYVDPSVLEQSLKSMIGLCEEQPSVDSAAAPSPGDSVQVAASAADQLGSLKQNVKKRRLYRKASDESVVWLPHDNHPDLLNELVWGSSSPRWILHGTPASGAGIMGCLEAGVSVIALCEDSHHETSEQHCEGEGCGINVGRITCLQGR